MQNKYFDIFTKCAALSVFILSIPLFVYWWNGQEVSSLGATVAAMLPLIYYHLQLKHKARQEAISNAEIDSVYYFGFLITVAALCMCALSIHFRGAADSIGLVVAQFGAGLIATGYAVYARMQLNAQAVALDDSSVEETVSRHIQKSREMITHLDEASRQLSEFSKTMMERNEEVSATARHTIEKLLQETTQAVREEFRETFAQARQGIDDIRALVKDTDFFAKREQLAQGFKSVTAGVTELHQALGELTVRTRDGAQSSQQTAARMAHLEQALAQMSQRVQDLAAPDGGLASAAQQLVQSGQTLSQGQAQMNQVVQSMIDIGHDVEASAPAFKSMTKVSKKVHEQLNVLAGVAEHMGSALASMDDSATSVEKLASHLDHMSTFMPGVAHGAESLQERLVKAAAAAQTLEGTLVSLPQVATPFNELAASVGQSLATVSADIAAISRHAQVLGEGAAGTDKAAMAAGRFADAVERLGPAAQTLQSQLQQLTSSTITAQRALDDSTTGLRTAFKQSADALQADVQRSGTASKLLTDSLVDVARTIVAQTSARHGSAA